jgi:hypothetical protein
VVVDVEWAACKEDHGDLQDLVVVIVVMIVAAVLEQADVIPHLVVVLPHVVVVLAAHVEHLQGVPHVVLVLPDAPDHLVDDLRKDLPHESRLLVGEGDIHQTHLHPRPLVENAFSKNNLVIEFTLHIEIRVGE